MVKIKPVYGEMSEEECVEHFQKFLPSDLDIELTKDNPDYYLLWNYPNSIPYEPKKTIYLKGEPFRYHLDGNWGMKSWGRWHKPNISDYLYVKNIPNNYFWFLNKNVDQLLSATMPKTETLSVCLSDKKFDPGHKLRIFYTHELQSRGIEIDVFGNCREFGFENFKGVKKTEFDPKDRSIFPYKYHLAFENCQEPDYFTEKIIDAILGECLVFYWGCPNIEQYVNPQCFIALTGDIDEDTQVIKRSIENKEWEKRLSFIQNEKKKILTQKTIMHDINKIIKLPKTQTKSLKPSKFKVAVYTICKNEEKFIDRFMDSAQEADEVFVLDTGSSDGSVEKLRNRGAIVEVGTSDPFRFDVVRNLSLDMVPNHYDICVCFDIDEVFDAGWRTKLEKAWDKNANRCIYTYYWSPERFFHYDKIHSRQGFKWVAPIHETLKYSGEENRVYSNDVILRHFPDGGKSRSQYLGLLKMSVEENPEDLRLLFYYGRELMFAQKSEEAIDILNKFINHTSSKWHMEEATAMRYLGNLFANRKEYDLSELWLTRAITHSNEELREPILDLVKILFYQQKYGQCYFWAKKCIGVTKRLPYYIVEGYAWGYEVFDYGSRSAWFCGDKISAISWCKKAIKLSEEQYLKDNLTYFLNN